MNIDFMQQIIFLSHIFKRCLIIFCEVWAVKFCHAQGSNVNLLLIDSVFF